MSSYLYSGDFTAKVIGVWRGIWGAGLRRCGVKVSGGAAWGDETGTISKMMRVSKPVIFLKNRACRATIR